jgi:hypothetical protein
LIGLVKTLKEIRQKEEQKLQGVQVGEVPKKRRMLYLKLVPYRGCQNDLIQILQERRINFLGKKMGVKSLELAVLVNELERGCNVCTIQMYLVVEEPALLEPEEKLLVVMDNYEKVL